jgi:hypothetical protein
VAAEKAYPSFENFPTIGRPNITYVAQDTGYKYIFNQGYRIVSGSAQQINNKRPNPNGTTDLTASNVGAYSTQETNNLLNEKVPTTRTITINGDTKDLSENRDWTVGAAPAGSNKQVQFNDAGNFGADADFTYDKTTNTLTTDTFKGDTLQSDSSAGVKIKSNSGSDVALFGAGGGQNATFYDGVKLDAKTASEILATDASKNIQTLSTATYPSLTELSYVKGVTSPIEPRISREVVASNTITFDNPKQFGSPASPRSGALLTSYTNAQNLLVAVVYHNDTTLSFPVSWTNISSIAYTPSQNNVICVAFIGNSKAVLTILGVA